MSDEAHLKDWYVARVVTLEGENRKLRNEVKRIDMAGAEAVRKLTRFLFVVCVGMFAAGYFLACILWRVFK